MKRDWNRVAVAVLCAAFFCVCGDVLSAQSPALYQQSSYKGREIGKLTGDVYYARMLSLIHI